MLTRIRKFVTLRKLAEMSSAAVKRLVRQYRANHAVPKAHIETIYSATKFEDTYRGFARLVLDPKPRAKANAVGIFDNIVERASREMMQNLV